MTNPGAPNPLPKDISNPNRIEPMLPVGGSDQPREASTPFQSMMKTPGATQQPPTGPASPFDLAKAGGAPLTAGPNLTTIQTQVGHAQSTLGDLNNMLSTPNLKLKPSTKYLLRSKLSDATQQLHTVNHKVGGDPTQEEGQQDLAHGSGPIQTFLGYVSAGQSSLASAKQKIQDISEQGENMNPAELLLVQIKLNKAQQLLDYSSVLLSKAIDDMKMLFNIQL
jgi:hypothetical protein